MCMSVCVLSSFSSPISWSTRCSSHLEVNSKCTYPLLQALLSLEHQRMLCILATKSLQACCLLVIICIFCLFLLIQCWKKCFKKRFWYKQDASSILLSNFWESSWWSQSWASYSYNRHKLSLPVCCIILFTAPTCFGHMKWSSSGSHKLHRCIQHIFQVIFSNGSTAQVDLCLLYEIPLR